MSCQPPVLASASLSKIPLARTTDARSRRGGREAVRKPAVGSPISERTDAASHPVTAAILVRIVGELSRMAQQLERPYVSSPFCDVLERAHSLLGTVAELLHHGRISPPPSVRVTHTAAIPAAARGVVRLGVFPVNGNPLHWGHLLCALEAIALLRLDQVVLLVQGIDARKPLAAEQTQADRHALARQVVAMFDPLLAYSDVGRDNSLVGEESLFRLLRLNPRTRIVAHYVVGADHYRLADPAGRPDTLPRLEQSMADPALGFDASRHEVRVVFVERGERPSRVPTRLLVDFIPATLDSSSTAVRNGDVALTPHLVYQYLREHPAYAAAIGFRERSIQVDEPAADGESGHVGVVA